MIELKRIEDHPIPIAALRAYETAVAAVGAQRFYKILSGAIGEDVPVDRLYVFEGKGGAQALHPVLSETEDSKPSVSEATYANHFLPNDPLQAAIEAAEEGTTLLRLRIRPSDIAVPSYRIMLERAGVIERVSFIGKHGRGWRCMTVVRRGPADLFDDQELALLGGYFRLLSPLIDQHRRLIGEGVEDRLDRIGELEDRFASRFPALTARERQICARAAIGISIEGAALDLGIGSASVLTYRKRAYRRLGVSSAYELARLVMR